jgi:hypothetical protein
VRFGGPIRCEARGNAAANTSVTAAAMRPAEVQFAAGLASGLGTLSIELSNDLMPPFFLRRFFGEAFLLSDK